MQKENDSKTNKHTRTQTKQKKKKKTAEEKEMGKEMAREGKERRHLAFKLWVNMEESLLLQESVYPENKG